MLKLVVFLVAVLAVWGATFPLSVGIPHRGRFPLKNSERSIPGGRLIGGDDADIADYPYTLELFSYGHRLCAASLIDSKWALTAAFCTQSADIDELYVIAGSADLLGGQEVRIASIHQHPNYANNNYYYDYDISILELAEDVSVEYASPIAIHDAGFVAEEGSDATITSWGYLSADFSTPAEVLQVLVSKIISNEQCSWIYLDDVTDRMACYGNWEEGGEGGCYEDWGAPVVVDGKLYGILGFTPTTYCAQRHGPQFITKASEESIREFIGNVTGL